MKRGQRVITQRTNDRVMFEKRELLLALCGLAFEQLANRTQTIRSVRERDFAGLIQRLGGMFAGKRLQADQNSYGFNTARLRRGFGPLAAVRPDGRDLPQQRVGASFHGRDFLLWDVLGGRTKAAWFGLRVHHELVPPIVIDAHQSRVPAHPEATPHVLGRRGVERFVHFHVAIAVNAPARFMKEREAIARQWPQRRTFASFKLLADLLFRRAVQPGIRDLAFD